MALDGQLRETAAELYQLGDLAWKLDDHQLIDYHAWRDWNVERQTREHLQRVADMGALFDNLWIDECGRRYGKTVRWLITDVEEMIRRPGCRGLVATPLQKSIGGIIVPLTKVLFRDAPPDYFPRYVASKGADHEGLYIAATDSYCKLVGLDAHPDATRGQFLDFAHITEAAFVRDLEELVTAVLMPQFRYRPWAWLAMETSTAKVPGCDFNRVFRPDAKLRGTYRIKTIRDNPLLSEEEIETEERRSGGRHSPVCRRELYCEEVRDPQALVVPEFDAPTADRQLTAHVREVERPRYAKAIAAMDPGMRDMFALLWGYWDAANACLVVERDWAERNASTGKVAKVIRQAELELYGDASASSRAVSAYLLPARRVGWAEIDALKVPCARVPGQDAPEGMRWYFEPQDFGIDRPEGLTYWSGEAFQCNPCLRVSDTDARLIGDLVTEHEIQVSPTSKDDKEAALFAVRDAFRAGKIIVHPRCKQLIDHLTSAIWNERRTDYERTEAHGHYDLLDALVYMWRMVQPLRADNPVPPVHVDRSDPGVTFEPLNWRSPEVSALEALFL